MLQMLLLLSPILCMRLSFVLMHASPHTTIRVCGNALCTTNKLEHAQRESILCDGPHGSVSRASPRLSGTLANRCAQTELCGPLLPERRQTTLTSLTSAPRIESMLGRALGAVFSFHSTSEPCGSPPTLQSIQTSQPSNQLSPSTWPVQCTLTYTHTQSHTLTPAYPQTTLIHSAHPIVYMVSRIEFTHTETICTPAFVSHSVRAESVYVCSSSKHKCVNVSGKIVRVCVRICCERKRVSTRARE